MNEFWGIIGQDNNINTISSMIKNRQLPHAILLVGLSNCGKYSLGIKIAQSLNCPVSSMGSPCGTCYQCKRISSLGYPDLNIVKLISTAEGDKSRAELSIEQIREIQRLTVLPPYEGRYRVIIIENADKMSNAAANALLKTLEEPVGNTVFILTSTTEDTVSETVRSRCRLFKINPVSQKVILRYLMEQLEIQEGKGVLLSRICEGRVGWAITAAYQDELMETRASNCRTFFEIFSSDFCSRFELTGKLINQYTQRRKDIDNILIQWLSLSRDIVLHQLDLRELIINIDYSGNTLKLAQLSTIEETTQLIADIIETQNKLQCNGNPRLTLEVLMINIPLLTESVGING